MNKGESTRNSNRKGIPKVSKEEFKQISNTKAPDEEKERRRLKELEDKYSKTKGRNKL